MYFFYKLVDIERMLIKTLIINNKDISCNMEDISLVLCQKVKIYY